MVKLEPAYYGDDIEFIPIDRYLPMGKKPSPLEKKAEEMFPGYAGKAKPPQRDEGDFLEEILTEKLTFLREILCDIDRQMHGREALRKDLLERMDYWDAYLGTKLLEIEPWGMGSHKGMDQRRTKLEQEVEALKREKREETRGCWQDIALLKKERRQFYHEYRNALRRMKVLGMERGDSDDEA